MSASSILGTLRELQVMVLNPPGDVSDALVLQLIRIGCSVRQCWPPPEQFDVHVDVIFTGIFQNRHHEEISGLITASHSRTTVVALVEYESPAVLSQIIELECHGVIIQPLDARRILPALVSARRVSEELAKLKQKNEQLQERLTSQVDINKAKVLLMKLHNWEESEAHSFLSHEAMKSREPILKVAQGVLKKHKCG
ncbi:ANTAR domain-containing response regulator [Ectopseudomonas alcaliphila]|uniref:ANTAR domain-containing protein n=1 Tax=Ectopseudomonas alcaliphila TaxID=101564 RepID=A0A1G7JK02_9GAMM|nr:ANTAR domain-containing protein [Pseudomonas alcaliphila]MDX5990499.1 ANTAR domain-containing protein [Pseudomonas alcaliphila]SDF25292.1 Two-component response regulator, AmiR/NasT family, consists of REC and RNA-binding antiterminator (ANTAR) domains [Pseudomonas alcaliphila]